MMCTTPSDNELTRKAMAKSPHPIDAKMDEIIKLCVEHQERCGLFDWQHDSYVDIREVAESVKQTNFRGCYECGDIDETATNTADCERALCSRCKIDYDAVGTSYKTPDHPVDFLMERVLSIVLSKPLYIGFVLSMDLLMTAKRIETRFSGHLIGLRVSESHTKTIKCGYRWISSVSNTLKRVKLF